MAATKLLPISVLGKSLVTTCDSRLRLNSEDNLIFLEYVAQLRNAFPGSRPTVYISLTFHNSQITQAFQLKFLEGQSVSWTTRVEVSSSKGKIIPVTGRGGPYDCEMSRLPQFLDNRLTDGGELVSLTRRTPFTPMKIPGTHFCKRLSRPQD
jgi:hypothetical protein